MNSRKFSAGLGTLLLTMVALTMWAFILSMIAAIVARADDVAGVEVSESCTLDYNQPTPGEIARAVVLAEADTAPKIQVLSEKCWRWPHYEAVYVRPQGVAYLQENWRDKPLGFFVLVHEFRHHRQFEKGTFFRLGPNGRECDAYEHTANVMIGTGSDKKIGVQHRIHGRQYCALFIAEELAR